jgi:hypothetical protein
MDGLVAHAVSALQIVSADRRFHRGTQERHPKRRQLWHCVRRFAPTLAANAHTYSILESKMFGETPVID